jgi:hypothetical protein
MCECGGGDDRAEGIRFDLFMIVENGFCALSNQPELMKKGWNRFERKSGAPAQKGGPTQ